MAESPWVTGDWIAFHLLEHDIHHRADIFHYLALLGIATLQQRLGAARRSTQMVATPA